MIININKEEIIRRLLSLVLLVILFVLCFQIIRFFISPILWAAIIAYVTWPFYLYLTKKLNLGVTLSASILTLGVVVMIGVPLIIGLFVLQQEALGLYGTILNRIKGGYLNLPDFVKDLPVVGQQIKDALWEINKDPDGTMLAIRNWIQSHLSYGKEIFDVLVRMFARLGIAMMALFFFYRDGIALMKQVRQATQQAIGDRVHGYIQAIGETTQAVVYGIGLTALAQAVLAGLGYWVAGAPNPILLTLMTFVVALIPFGTPFAWGGVVIFLLSNGHTTGGIGLLIWGVLVVSWVDNLIRPMVISGATKIPFMIILIGVLGGLTAFGFIGLFIGPVVLAVALAVWREWLTRQHVEQLNQEKLIQNQHENDAPISAITQENQPIQQEDATTPASSITIQFNQSEAENT